MKSLLRNVLATAAVGIATQAIAQVTFYEQDGFRGQSFTTARQVGNLERTGFNDRASSVVVLSNRWEVCEDVRFNGRCVVLRPGRYPSLAAMGLNDRVSSVRAVARNARINEQRYAPAPVAAQVTFYENEGFGGRSFTADGPVENFQRENFNDRASSVVVTGNPWEVCEDIRFNGRCVVLRPGQYPSLAAMGMNDRASSVRPVNGDARSDEQRYAPAPVAAQVTFYENEGFGGRSFTTDGPVENFQRGNFNDRASSVVVTGNPWEVCEDVRFSGRCSVLRPGQYPSLAAMGLNDRASSVRPVNGDARSDEQRRAPAPIAVPDYRRRDNERLYEVNVTSVRAVVGTPEQRCWIEREQVAQDRGNANVPGAIAGALIGGILGHQIGGGTGKDFATAGGAVAGAAIGANVGRNDGGQQASAQDVQRCETVPSQAKPQYWDVTYNFRGVEHRIQMTAPPGPTVTVNERGEPRK
jgi:uncharacterized protein YcfJ